MADLLLLTPSTDGSAQVLPALALLGHRVRVLPSEPSALLDAPDSDVLLLDARRDLAGARSTCRLLRATGLTVPLVLVLTEGGMTAVTAEWGAADVVLADASPAEVEARLRLVIERARSDQDDDVDQEISSGDLTIDAGGYTARVRGRPLDLTYKEFELLKYLAQHPGRVFTRAQVLQEVWGYDYFGGTRTVDVHVRRLRAKLGPEHEQLIGTVRNVGYRFDPPRERGGAESSTGRPGGSEDSTGSHDDADLRSGDDADRTSGDDADRTSRDDADAPGRAGSGRAGSGAAPRAGSGAAPRPGSGAAPRAGQRAEPPAEASR